LAAELKTTVDASDMAVAGDHVEVEGLLRREVQVAWKTVEVAFEVDLVGDHVAHVPENLLAVRKGARYRLGDLFYHDGSKRNEQERGLTWK
jgi:hypothetical protein